MVAESDGDISLLLKELDMLSYQFRVEKSSERGYESYWKVIFINPQDKTWYERSGVSLSYVLSKVVEILRY